MILGDDGEKLSKRHGAVSVTQYEDERLPARGDAQLPGAAGLEPWRRRALRARAAGAVVRRPPPGEEPGAVGRGQADLGQCARTSSSAATRRWRALVARAAARGVGIESADERWQRLCALFKDRCATTVRTGRLAGDVLRRRASPRDEDVRGARHRGGAPGAADAARPPRRRRLGQGHDRRGDEGNAGRARTEDAAAGARPCACSCAAARRRRRSMPCSRCSLANWCCARLQGPEKLAIIAVSLEQRWLHQRHSNGGIAQLGERLHGMQEVSGSIPLTSTKTAWLHSAVRADRSEFKSPSSRGLGHHPFTVITGVRIP